MTCSISRPDLLPPFAWALLARRSATTNGGSIAIRAARTVTSSDRPQGPHA